MVVSARRSMMWPRKAIILVHHGAYIELQVSLRPTVKTRPAMKWSEDPALGALAIKQFNWRWQTLPDWQFTSSTSGRKALSIRNKHFWINKLKVLARTVCQKGSDKSTQRRLFDSRPKLIFLRINDWTSTSEETAEKEKKDEGENSLINRITGLSLLQAEDEGNVSQTYRS